jgi:hypothetical protein
MKKLKHLTFSAMLFLEVLLIASCTSQLEPPRKPENTSALHQADLVLVPSLGWVPKSIVHRIETGSQLLRQGGHIYKLESSTGKQLEDFGEIQVDKMRKNERTLAANPNWIASSSWTNPSGQPPLNYFSTSWSVPNNPVGSDGQTLFLFNALNAIDGSTILQPVLQWGISSAGGGNYWAITNWYIQPGFVGFMPLYTNSGQGLAPGTNLLGYMTYQGQQAGNHSLLYTSAFSNYPNQSLALVYGLVLTGGSGNSVPIVSIYQNEATETLEAYGNGGPGGIYPPNANDYPVGQVSMKNINLQTANGHVSLFWSGQNPYLSSPAPLGQFSFVVSNNSSGSGEVDIYFGCTITRSVTGFVWVNPADEFFWNAVPGATSYFLSIPGAGVPRYTTGGTSIADARAILGLTPGHQYTATINPIFPCGTGTSFTNLIFTP